MPPHLRVLAMQTQDVSSGRCGRKGHGCVLGKFAVETPREEGGVPVVNRSVPTEHVRDSSPNHGANEGFDRLVYVACATFCRAAGR